MPLPPLTRARSQDCTIRKASIPNKPNRYNSIGKITFAHTQMGMVAEMEKAQIIKTVNEFLIEEFEADADDIVAGKNMHEALDLDSLDYVDLVVLIDENFGFKTTSEDFRAIKTFDDFYNFISSKVNG